MKIWCLSASPLLRAIVVCGWPQSDPRGPELLRPWYNYVKISQFLKISLLPSNMTFNVSKWRSHTSPSSGGFVFVFTSQNLQTWPSTTLETLQKKFLPRLQSTTKQLRQLRYLYPVFPMQNSMQLKWPSENSSSNYEFYYNLLTGKLILS